METLKRNTIPFFRMAVIMVTALYETYALVTSLPSELGQNTLFRVAGVIFIGFVFWHLYVVSHELSEFKNKRSNVVADISLYNKLEPAFYEWHKHQHSRYKVKRYFLPFRQRTIKGIRLIDTEPVYAEVHYYDDQGNELKELTPIEAFWGGSKPRARRQTAQDRNIVIKKSGDPEGVCLAIKKSPASSDLYAFSHENYIPGTGDFEWNACRRIKCATAYVSVKITDGAFVNKTIWVRITNLGKNQDPLFELVVAPRNVI